MLVKHRFQCVDDAVFLPRGSTHLFEVDRCLHFGCVSLHQLHDSTITEVRFDQAEGGFVFLCSSKNLTEGFVRVTVLVSKDVTDKDKAVKLTHDHGNGFVFSASRGVHRNNSLPVGDKVRCSLRPVPSIARESNSRKVKQSVLIGAPDQV